MLTTNLAAFKFFFNFIKSASSQGYQNSENPRSQKEKVGLILSLAMAIVREAIWSTQMSPWIKLLFSPYSHFHFCLLMLSESIPSVLCHGNTCRWRPYSSLPALPVMKRQLITAQGEECNLQDTHEQFEYEGVPEAHSSHRCLTCLAIHHKKGK